MVLDYISRMVLDHISRMVLQQSVNFEKVMFRNRLLEERILKREGGTLDKIIINSKQKVRPRVLNHET